MKYRTLGNEKVSTLGFGAMRLPIIGDDPARIDEVEAARMLHYGIDHGVNYVDTAWPYHRGESENFVGRALRSGWRRKVNLATKLPSWFIQTHEDCDKYLNQQLEKLQTDTIDFYLLHSLGGRTWEQLMKADVLSFVERALKDGRIRHIGFSYHDEQEHFAPIVDACNWTFCQIQYNYMDTEVQAGTKGLKYAASKGLDIIGMEPLRGGRLTKNVPESILKLMRENGINRTPAELALRWVWNHPEVKCVLSGMSTFDQVVENCRLANEAEPGYLTEKESEIIEQIKKLYRERRVIDCTRCSYCMPCPQGVDIPSILSVYNDLNIYRDEQSARNFYSMFIKPENKADKCIECGECLEKCPQSIPIAETLKEAHETLTGK